MNRIFVLADADSLWTKRYFSYVLEGRQAVLFPIWGISPENEAWYAERSVTVYHDRHKLPVIRHIPRLRMWARIVLNAKDIIAMGPFDAVQNHYLSQRDLALGGIVARKFKTPWACCFWGSDLLRATPRSLRQMKPWLKQCTAIHSEYGGITEKIRKVYGDEFAKKARMIPHGNEVLDRMRTLAQTADRRKCKELCGFDPDSTVVCVGYNAGEPMQHMKVLEQLAKLPEETLKGITLVLQMNYCETSPEYTESVAQAAGKLPCKTVVIRKFLNSEESAKLRMAADIFLHAIITDAFSASFCEYLCAGAVCIRGSWLKYPNLDERGIFPPTFDDFEELPQLIEKALKGEIPPIPGELLEQLQTFYSASASRDVWLGLYEPVQR